MKEKHSIGKWLITLGIVAGALALAVGLTLLGRFVIQKIYGRSPDINSMLEFFGAVLTFVGTVTLGVVSVWQTKQANEFARMVQEVEHRPSLVISQVQYEDILKDELNMKAPSVSVLRLKREEEKTKYKWTDDELRYHEDLFYRDAANKGSLRKDILFLEILNDSKGLVTISVEAGDIRQSFPTGGGYDPIEDFDREQEPIGKPSIGEKRSRILAIRDAGRANSDDKRFDKEWKLILPLRVSNRWMEEIQTWEILYKIDNKTSPQSYTIESPVTMIGSKIVKKDTLPRETGA